MSNQVYRNAANGGQKYYPQAAKNLYQMQADVTGSAANYSNVAWDSFLWDKLNGTNVTATTVSGVTTYNYLPVASTVDEVTPSSISNVGGGTTYFYFKQNGCYHIEFSVVLSDVVGNVFIGIEVSDYDADANTWTVQPIQCRVGGVNTNGSNPLVLGISVDKTFTTMQRMRPVYKMSNATDFIAANTGLGGTSFIISKSS